MPRKSVRSSVADRSRVRIIAGQWRGRWISFKSADGLRPTGDRVRETLFNWLQNQAPASHCLDLYAGSGALGIEAASRGAQEVTLVDNNSQVVSCLRAEVAKLSATTISVVQTDALSFLRGVTGSTNQAAEDEANGGRQFDLVFIDPPFGDNCQLDTLHCCLESGVLCKDARVYVEAPASARIDQQLPADFQLLKSRKAGNVQFLLLSFRR